MHDEQSGAVSAQRIVRLEAAVRGLHDQVVTLLGEVRTLALAVQSQTVHTSGSVSRAAPAAGAVAAEEGAPTAAPPKPIELGFGVAYSPLSRAPALTPMLVDAISPGGPPSAAPPATTRPDAPASAATRASAPRPVELRPSDAERFAPRPERRRLNFEELMGRYGTMAVATLTILLGVGTFINWAVANNRLGPVARVGLGLLAAVVFAGAGAALRRRGTIRFGNTLLALALAIVHVDAWGAGLHLKIIPAPLAMGMAALASLALVALALSDRDQTLFSVGIGGALAAPFVAPTEHASVLALLGYGLAVITAGLYAMRGQQWRFATRVMWLAGICYALAAHAGVRDAGSPVERAAATTFALLCAIAAALVASAEYRAGLVRWYLGTGVGALILIAAVHDAQLAPMLVALAAAGTVTGYVLLHPVDEEPHRWMVDALVLPLGFLFGALTAIDDMMSTTAIALTVGWTLMAIVAAFATPEERRGPHWLAAGLASLVAVIVGLRDAQAPRAIALSVYGTGLALVMRRRGSKAMLLPIMLAIYLGGTWSLALLSQRTPFQYTPFVNAASFAVLAAALALWNFVWQLVHTQFDGDAPMDQDQAVFLRTLGPLPLFFWARTELAGAHSPDMAAFLLTGYYAAAGVLAIWFGRVRELPPLRRVGLALAFYGALKVLLAARDFTAIGLKVLSFFMVGGFFLAVAYWYRSTGEESPASARQT